MYKFFKNSKGAVTVFVTLLLIPAILVSGMSVDLARMHTARSILQDANQIAANSVLTQYDALLKDVYGLYGVMEDDPILGGMLYEYICVSVFGEDWQDKSLGTFQIFYGSDLQEPVVAPASNKNLRNPEVLKRQIEEYEKLRAPVVFLDEIKILDIISGLSKLVADVDAIHQQMDIDDEIDELDKTYKRIFNRINTINTYADNMNASLRKINDCLTSINGELRELQSTRSRWTSAYRSDNDDLMSDYNKKYNGILANIKSMVAGGKVNTDWVDGKDDLDVWSPGHWDGSYNISSNALNNVVNDLKRDLKSFKSEHDSLESDCVKADRKREEIAVMVDRLENKLKDCSGALKEGMNTPIDGKSMMDHYRDIAKYELEKMALELSKVNVPYIEQAQDLLDNIGYGYVSGVTLMSPMISPGDLTRLSSNSSFAIDFTIKNESASPPAEDKLSRLANVSSYRYTFNWPFLRFEDSAFNPTKNKEFYDELQEMYGNAGTNDKKDSMKKSILYMLQQAQMLLKRLTLTPKGAQYYSTSSLTDDDSFGKGKDWSREGEAKSETKGAIKPGGSFIQSLGNLFGSAADKLLLLTYDTKMFSNFTTSSGKTMTGVPFGKEMNYFFQSEQEYLFNGNLDSAKGNILAVSGMILLIRFVLNYISAFVVTEINSKISTLKASLAATGPWAIVISELARLAWALAESLIDVVALLNRQKVTIFKMKYTDWYISPGAVLSDPTGKPKFQKLIESMLKEFANEIGDGAKDVFDAVDMLNGEMSIAKTPVGSIKLKDGEFDFKGRLDMGYSDYLWILLLFKDSDTLALRTSDLIALNITNKKGGFNADEAAMASVERFDMEKAMTDFSITTTADMRMLFLSMPFAQKGIDGVVPPKTIPLTVTDYRGY